MAHRSPTLIMSGGLVKRSDAGSGRHMTDTMQALVYLPSYELELREVERPSPAVDEVVVRVEAAGICGSDVQGVSSHSPRRAPPLVMGHELCGEVVAAGG